MPACTAKRVVAIIYLPMMASTTTEEDEEEDDVEDAQADVPVKADLMEEVMQEDEEAISSGILSLTDAGMVDAGLSKALTSMHKQTFRRVACSALPVYEEHTVKTKKAIKKKRHNPFVEISYKGKVMHIHKTTVVWLFQEGERVSADRLFRVRGNQPYSSQQVGAIACRDTQIPGVHSTVHTGEICVFTDPVKSWKVGRIVQFAYYKETTKKLKQYPGNSASLTDDIGVLCSWYVASESNPARFSVGISDEAHVYCGITSYLCTLTHGCFAEIDRVGGTLKPGCNTSEACSILATDANAVDLLTARHFIINTASLSFIDSLQREVQVKANVSINVDDVNSKDARDSAKEHWVTHGSIKLTKTERLALTSGKELSDQHVNAFQHLLKVTVENLHGLQNTVLQETYSLAERPPGVTALQIIHVRRSHWVALEMAQSSVDVYDSSYTSITTDTQKTIAKLLHSKEKSICTNIMNVSRQAGVTDCALFAMAFTTHLAFGKDPTTAVFDQNELRSHLLVMLSSGKVSTFPVLKRRRPSSRVLKVESFDIYCYCRMPDDGNVMVCCDQCNEWYHHKCAKGTENLSDVSWYCSKCYPPKGDA